MERARIAGGFLLVLLAGALAPRATAQILLIDFDVDPDDVPIASGTSLETVYASLGVTFEQADPVPICMGVWANDNHPGDFGSLPNVATTCPHGNASDISESSFGLVQANFAFDARRACVAVRPDGASDEGVLRAYAEGGGLLDEAVSTAGLRETICVEADGIRSVRFSGHELTYARFDDLIILPEPAASGLAAVALVSVAVLRRIRVAPR